MNIRMNRACAQARTLIVVFAVFMAGVTAGATGDSITLDRVQQRYPWNGLVDIDYTITSAAAATLGADDNLEVLMIDKSGSSAVTNRALTFLQAPLPMTAGQHRITWNANADGVQTRTDAAEFVIEVAHYPEAYMIIDVSGGSSATVYPTTFANRPPAGGFSANDEYRGNKIVLRRIHPGSYMAGSPTNEANRVDTNEKQHRVVISRPFYIGIFEVTQQQYENVMGKTPSKYAGPYRPVESVVYSTIRGGSWPTSTSPGANTFMDKLLQKCKSKGSTGAYTEAVEGFDLPTEFQWEYACRAGTAGAFNTTNAYDNADAGAQEAQLAKLGRYSGNKTDEHGNSDAHTVVGSYLPNAWGLYDMHGNVSEWCRDWYQDDVLALAEFVDPKGPESGPGRASRGGSYNNPVGPCRSGYRDYKEPGTGKEIRGFRLFRALP